MFHFAFIEEYYLGGMVIGLFNPITDMSIGVYMLYIYLGIYGNSQLQYVVFNGDTLWTGSPALTFLNCFYYFGNCLMSCNALACFYKTFKNPRYEGKGTERIWYVVFYQVLTYLVMVVAVTSIAYAGSNPMINSIK